MVRFCRFDDRQACKPTVLGEITNLWLNTPPFQRKFNMLLCSSKENISHYFCDCTETRHFIDAGCVRGTIMSKRIVGD